MRIKKMMKLPRMENATKTAEREEEREELLEERD